MTTIPPEKPIKWDSTKSDLQFSISVNLPFENDLENKSSKTYQEYAYEFQKNLMEAYKGTPGLHTIEIIGFSNGSIKAKYSVNLHGYQIQTLSESLNYINSKVIHHLTNLTIHNGSVNESIVTTEMTLQLEIVTNTLNLYGLCELLVDPCSFGYECTNKTNEIVCKNKCSSDPPTCSNGGECYVDYKDNRPKCRCEDSDEYYYSGNMCEVRSRKTEIVSLSAKDYAIIAGSSVSAVLLILIIDLFVRCKRKRARKGKEDMDLNDSTSDLSVARDSVRMSQMTTPLNNRSTFYTDGSSYPEMSKNYRVYMDSHTGQEAIIYQPTNMTMSLRRGSSELEPEESEQISPRSFYEYFDTAEPYKIKRPNLRVTRNWPL